LVVVDFGVAGYRLQVAGLSPILEGIQFFETPMKPATRNLQPVVT